MEDSVQNIPFLRVAVALVSGIYLGSVYPEINSTFVATAIVALSAIVFLINKIYKFHLQTAFGITINLIFLLFGVFIYCDYNKKPIFYENVTITATILELPQEKANSYQTIARINSFKKDEIIIPAHELLIIYFSKINEVRNLDPGSIIHFKSNPQQIKNFGNPYEFNYKKYLERKKIYRQVYLNDESWIKSQVIVSSFTIIAENTRQKLLNIYQNLPMDENEREILSALTLGYKRDLDPEIKRVFSSSGAMHVLAVSGLHVGIIFWIVVILFGYLRKYKSGRIFFTIIAILILWSYAFITGLSPSVMRAAAMITILIFGEILNRKANIYNSLAASAFILLIINPNNLFDTGFQLSYSAVFGIVYLQPKIRSILFLKNKILTFIWDLLCVSIAAQIATLPFILYYFGQFPAYFWLTNIIIIPAVMILIPLGIFLLLVAGIPNLGAVVAITINSIIKFIYHILAEIEQLPYSVLNTNITRIQQIILIVIILSFFIVLKYKKILYLYLTLLGAFMLIISIIYQNITNHKMSELVVYNNTENATFELIHGKLNFIISEKEIKESDQIKKAIEQTTKKRGLLQPNFLTFNDSIVNQNIFMKNGIIFFEGKTILFGNYKHIDKINNTDIIINPSKSTKNKYYSTNQEIIITNKSYIQKYNENISPNHSSTFETAFRKIW